MIIIGADYHPGFQQIAFVDSETGDYGEQRLQHQEEAERFYRERAAQGKKVRVGMEASGHARWFERLLAELNFELWIGDAAEMQTKRVRKQKTDREDVRPQTTEPPRIRLAQQFGWTAIRRHCCGALRFLRIMGQRSWLSLIPAWILRETLSTAMLE